MGNKTLAQNSGKIFGKIIFKILGVWVCAQDVNFTPAAAQQLARDFWYFLGGLWLSGHKALAHNSEIFLQNITKKHVVISLANFSKFQT